MNKCTIGFQTAHGCIFVEAQNAIADGRTLVVDISCDSAWLRLVIYLNSSIAMAKRTGGIKTVATYPRRADDIGRHRKWMMPEWAR